MNRKIRHKKLDNLKWANQTPTNHTTAKQTRTKQTQTKQTQTKQNICKRNIQDAKCINLTKININNKGTFNLAADNKYNYPETKMQEIKQNVAIEIGVASNRIKTKITYNVIKKQQNQLTITTNYNHNCTVIVFCKHGRK